MNKLILSVLFLILSGCAVFTEHQSPLPLRQIKADLDSHFIYKLGTPYHAWDGHSATVGDCKTYAMAAAQRMRDAGFSDARAYYYWVPGTAYAHAVAASKSAGYAVDYVGYDPRPLDLYPPLRQVIVTFAPNGQAYTVQ